MLFKEDELSIEMNSTTRREKMNGLDNINITTKRDPSSYTLNIDEKIDQIILLYSGGLDTSCMIPWIKEKYKCDVLALTVDIGQQVDDFKAIQDKAYSIGAKEHILINAKEQLVKQYAFKAIKANARVGKDGHPISSSLTRPLIAQIAADEGNKRGIKYFAHGASGQSNDSVRFDTCILALVPGAKIIAPIREWSMSRDDEIEYARSHNIPVTATKESPFSIDDNIWGLEIEAGPLVDITQPVPEKTYRFVKNVTDAPNIPYNISVEFEKGISKKINGVSYNPVNLVQILNKLGAEHGIGRFDYLEDRAIGVKVRELHESPAAHILMTAYADLEHACLTPDSLRMKNTMDYEWTNMMLCGKCFDPIVEALNYAIDSLASHVNGTVHMKLYKGNCIITKRIYDNALDVTSLTKRGVIPNGVNQDTTTSYIEVSSLPLRSARIKNE